MDYTALRTKLYDRYAWIADVGDSATPLEVVRRVLSMEGFVGIDSVYHSSVWAVCMAYRHFTGDGVIMSVDELEYTRYRSGVIGFSIDGDQSILQYTIREYLETRNPGFSMFSHDSIHTGPRAA